MHTVSSRAAAGALRPLALALAVAMLALLASGCGPEPEAGSPRGVAEIEAAAGASGPPVPPSATELNVGEAVERPILPGEIHDYLLVLEVGDFVEFQVEQRGIDVQLSLLDPDDELILVMDLPIADLGPESLMAVAAKRGGHLVRVKASPSEDPGGGYLATLVARRRADRVDELRGRAAKVFYQGELEYWRRRYSEAADFYDRAGELWRTAGDRLREALTLDRAGDAWGRLGELAGATDLHERAAALFADSSEARLAAINTNHLAELYFKRGKLDQAIEWHSHALELRRRTGDRRGEGMTHESLGRIYKVRGDAQLALDHFARALELLDRPEDRRHRATALHDLGSLYHRLGERQEAVRRLEAAERIYEELGDSRRQAYSLSKIGQLVFESGDPERALRILQSSLELSRRKADHESQVATLRRIGSVLQAGGDPDGARQRYLEALELLARLESPRSKAAVLADLASLHNRLGRSDEALEQHRRAREVFERVGDPLGQAQELLGEAVSQRQLGRLEAARAPAARALEISEALRVNPYSEELRQSFFTTAQPYFDFNIDLLMELHRASPGSGHDIAALQVSERARARLLLDLLSEAGAEIRDDAAPALLEQEREMQYRLNRAVILMESEETNERQRQEAAHEVDLALSRLDSIRAAIRRESPRRAALTQPTPLRLGEIQKLLDKDTALLEFRLGTERSFLWLVTREAMVSFELPPGEEIERNAREGHLLMMQARRESAGRTRALLCDLSRQLLQPAAAWLGRKRLAIVPDGALEYLPFAALPDPGSAADCNAAEPLIVAHEVLNLPSASTLSVLRREAAGRQRATGTIAVLADPVFSVDDPRVEARRAPTQTPGGPRTAAQRGGEVPGQGAAFRRLPHTRGEAQAILRLVSPDSSYAALGFDASKEAVLSGRLKGYRIVHLATHGDLDAERPALSRIVLSQVDRQGLPVEGSLRAHEIYNLRLPADLVVLSGCETALGKEVRGEGLVGLARGFMYAGASRVLVSLWKVSDRGTAELMEQFYRGLLEQGLTPAAALRRAQVAVRLRNPQPFYWAGFVLQGDWR